MSSASSERNFSYGAVFQTGDFVQRGDIVGLSVDGKQAVKAPMSGWVRILPQPDSPESDPIPLIVEIWRLPDYTGENYSLPISR